MTILSQGGLRRVATSGGTGFSKMLGLNAKKGVETQKKWLTCLKVFHKMLKN